MALVVTGCATSGPITVRSDRFNFNEAGAESAKEQILLNIVRLRYGEPIYFVDIGSMLSHYTLSAGGHYSNYNSDLNVWNNPLWRGFFGMRGEPVPGSQTWGADLNYTDSPTITYSPVTGEEFATRVMAPISPSTIIYLSQSGWSIDRLMECCVQQINDLGNTPIHELGPVTPPDTRAFRRLTTLLKKAQDAGCLRFSIEFDASLSAAYLLLHAVPADMQTDVKEARELLGLSPAAPSKVRLTAISVRTENDEVAMQTRSLLATMYALSQRISVPENHFRDRQTASQQSSDLNADAPVWLKVEHSLVPQVDAFAQVFYNGYWFYIEKSDWSSKRTFALLTYLFSLQSTAKGQMEPFLTVPTGG